jgi:hypothetical protein
LIRRNAVHDCGTTGICGIPAGEGGLRGVLVEHNRLERNCWQDVESLYECAAIKLHITRDTLVRHNVILDNGYGCGIWMDWHNENSRVCGNAVVGGRKVIIGAIFIEGCLAPNLVDNNVVMNIGADARRAHGGGHGLMTQESDFSRFEYNLCCNTAGAGVFCHRGYVDRKIGPRSASGRRHRIVGNILVRTDKAIWLSNTDNTSDRNIIGVDLETRSPLWLQAPEERLDLEAWQTFLGLDSRSRHAAVEVEFDRQTLTLDIRVGLDGCVHTDTWRLDQPLRIADFVNTVLPE